MPKCFTDNIHSQEVLLVVVIGTIFLHQCHVICKVSYHTAVSFQYTDTCPMILPDSSNIVPYSLVYQAKTILAKTMRG